MASFTSSMQQQRNLYGNCLHGNLEIGDTTIDIYVNAFMPIYKPLKCQRDLYAKLIGIRWKTPSPIDVAT